MTAKQNSSTKLAIRIPEALHRAAKAKAAEEGLSLEAVIASFIAQWVEPERIARVESLLRGSRTGAANTVTGEEGYGSDGADTGRRKGGN